MKLRFVIFLTGMAAFEPAMAQQNPYEDMDLYRVYHSTVGCENLDDAMFLHRLLQEEKWPEARAAAQENKCRFVEKGEFGRLVSTVPPLICLAMGRQKREPDPDHKREFLCLEAKILHP